jgi:tetratricopeptide (TPR) repeat protein
MARVVNGRLGEVYEQMGRYDDALAAFDKAGGGAPSYEVARTYARMGRHREARQMLAELGGTSTAFTSAAAASVYTALGDRDEAFRLLFAAVDHGQSPPFLTVDPPFDPLHVDARWTELVRRHHR